MISTKEKVFTKLSELSEEQLKQVAVYLEFLQFRERSKTTYDENDLESLFAEFADEDRELAEQGISENNELLSKMDDANFVVSPEKYEQFLEALDEPPKSIPALRQLFLETT